MVHLKIAGLTILVALCLQAQEGDVAATIEEWEVPWEQTRPRDPSVAPDGTIWFVGQQGNYAATLNPETGEFTQYEVPEGAHPHSILVDDFGRPWYTGNADSHIGRIDPATGEVTVFPTPSPAARDPHTMTFSADGGLWFTSQSGNTIGRLDTASGEVELLTPSQNGSRPYGILTAPNGIIWADLFGTNKLARIDPTQRTLTEIELPRSDTRPRRIGVTSDGIIWYGDYSEGFTGSYNPQTGETREWPNPSGGNSAPYAMAVDDLDRIWFVETGPSPNNFVMFDPGTEEFTSHPVPSGGGSIRHMVFDPKTRTIWFGSDAGTIGGAVVLGDGPIALKSFDAHPDEMALKVSSKSLSFNVFSGLNSPITWTIYSTTGNVVPGFSGVAIRGQHTLSVAALPTGRYLFEVLNNQRVVRPFQILR